MIKFARQKKGEGVGNLMIKNWTPLHEAVVMAKVQGKNNSDIAREFNLGEASVSVICNSWQAKQKIAQITENIYKEGSENISEERKAIIRKAYERMKDFIDNDILASAAPFQYISQTIKIAEVMEAAERKSPEVSSVTNNNIVVLERPEHLDALREGLKRAEQARQLHSGTVGSIDKTVKEVEPKEKIEVFPIMKIAK